MSWRIGAAIFFGVVLVVEAVVIWLLLGRKTQTSGQPTPEEAKIIDLATKQRLDIAKETTESGAEVRRMSNAELEKALNDHSSD